MANITAKLVKELRDRTGVGMMDAKKALVEVDGDMDAAIDFLRTKGLATAAKKADRIAAEGLATAYVSGNTAAVVEVNSETDFVAKNEQFQTLVQDVVRAVAENKPANMEEALAIEVDGTTLQDAMTEATTKIGEKIDFRRFEILEKEDSDVFGTYVHAGGSIVAVVKITDSDDEEAARDVAMHVAAINPQFTNREDVSEEVYNREKEVQVEKTLAEGKPEHIVEKIVEGRMGKFYSEIVLVEQDFVKDSDMTVGQYIESKGGKVDSFVRFEVGEGIEKRQDNFAEEVAAQMNQ
ncbi:elongation factor Ts [Aerococcaceae bacterium DSM 111020]|nr:elongation factor Ts [Aerococcaceae bacterium DSM 111020]